ncbi:MAG: TIGR04086 family membrane protein [Clostridia bacterium]|nr:TIGR04086 family membrane protein [Clostridia bacterium]
MEGEINEKTLVRGVFRCVKTAFCAFAITAALLAVLAALICFAPLPEEAVMPVIYALNYFSVFMAGLISAGRGAGRGFLTGAFAGGVYMLLLYILGAALFGGISFTKGVLMQVLCCVATGTAGGIVGINIKHK